MVIMRNDLKTYGSKRNIWAARVVEGIVVSYDRSGAQCVCSKRPTEEQVQALADELTAEDFVPGMATTYTMEFAETKKGHGKSFRARYKSLVVRWAVAR